MLSVKSDKQFSYSPLLPQIQDTLLLSPREAAAVSHHSGKGHQDTSLAAFWVSDKKIKTVPFQPKLPETHAESMLLQWRLLGVRTGHRGQLCNPGRVSGQKSDQHTLVPTTPSKSLP